MQEDSRKSLRPSRLAAAAESSDGLATADCTDNINAADINVVMVRKAISSLPLLESNDSTTIL